MESTNTKEKLMDMIKIEQRVIGNADINSVDGRELWQSLEIKKDFSNWIKTQIKSLGLEENIDYITVRPKRRAEISEFKYRQLPIDYIITLDTAKHISIASRTEKGKEVRKYFIEAEKQLQQVDTNITLVPILHKMLERQEKQTNVMIGLLDNMQTQINVISTKVDNIHSTPILDAPKCISLKKKYNHNLKFVSKEDEYEYEKYLDSINNIPNKIPVAYTEDDFRSLNLPNKHHNTLYAIYSIQQIKQSIKIDNKDFYHLTTNNVVEYLSVEQSVPYTYIVLCKLSERDIIQKAVLAHNKIYFRICDNTINTIKENKEI